MGKFTFSSAVLAAALVAMPTFAQDSAESSSTFTPVTDLSTTTAGWYQMKLVSSLKGGSSIITSGANYIAAVDEERYISPVYYMFKYTAETESKKAATFLYITGTSTDSVYNVQSISGHYLGSKGGAYVAAQSVYLAQVSSGSNNYVFRDGSSKSGRYYDYYNASDEAPLMGAYSNANNCSLHQISAVDISQYDVYTVKFTGYITSNVSGASVAKNNIQVSCNSAENLGITKVYNGGKFIFPKGTNVTADMFNVENDDAMPTTSTERLITIDENKNILISYKREDLSLEDGAVVKFTNVGTTGTLRDIYMTETGLAVNTSSEDVGNQAFFIVKKLENGKYAFVSAATGTYLKYAGGYYDTSAKKQATDAGLAETYSDDYCAVTLHSTDNNVFNSYYLEFVRRNPNANNAAQLTGSTIIISSAGVFDGWGNSEGFTSAGYSNLFYIRNVSDYTYHNINLQSKDDKNYASVYLPFSYTLDDGVEAYYGKTVADDESKIVLTKIEDTVVPKATAVILMSDNVSGSKTLVPALNETAPTAISDNKLSGTLTSTAVESGKTYYGFTGKYDTIGFYKWTGATLPLGKAYLALDSSAASSQAFTLSFGGNVSGINNATTATDKANVYFDLSGRRVNNPTKGIYVVNGKKVIF